MALVRHGVYYLVGRLASAAVGMLSLYAFTRVLSPFDYGRYSIIVAMAGLVCSFVFQWLRQCLVKFGSDPDCDRQELLGSIGIIFLVLAVSAALVSIAVFAVGHDENKGFDALLIAATFAMTMAQAWFELGLDANRVDMQPGKYGVAGLLRAAFCLVFGLVAQRLMGSLNAMVFGIAAGYMLASILTAPHWLSGLARVRLASWEQVKGLVAYGVPLALTLGFTFVIDSANRLMLAGMSGVAEAGIYSSAYNLGQYALGNVLAGLGLAVFPLAVKVYAENGAEYTGALLGQNLLLLLGFALPSVAGLVVLAPTLTSLLLGNFVPGQSALITAIVVIGVAFAAIRSYAYDIIFMLTKRTGKQTGVLAVAACINMLLNVVLIPRFGAIGAASATLFSFLIALCLSMWMGRSLIKIRVRLDDLAKLVVGSGVMVGALLIPVQRHTWLSLISQIALGSMVYAGAMLILNPMNARIRISEWIQGKLLA